jgi:hypothetical protein
MSRLFKSVVVRNASTEAKAKSVDVSAIHETLNELTGALSRLPTTPMDRSRMIAELRLQKKDARLRKREAIETLRSARLGVRQESAGLPLRWINLLTGRKLVALQRRALRAGKEQATAPLEDQRTAIDRLLPAIDREILPLESFAE